VECVLVLVKLHLQANPSGTKFVWHMSMSQLSRSHRKSGMREKVKHMKKLGISVPIMSDCSGMEWQRSFPMETSSPLLPGGLPQSLPTGPSRAGPVGRHLPTPCPSVPIAFIFGPNCFQFGPEIMQFALRGRVSGGASRQARLERAPSGGPAAIGFKCLLEMSVARHGSMVLGFQACLSRPHACIRMRQRDGPCGLRAPQHEPGHVLWRLGGARLDGPAAHSGLYCRFGSPHKGAWLWTAALVLDS
jgi:hypothetical protein